MTEDKATPINIDTNAIRERKCLPNLFKERKLTN